MVMLAVVFPLAVKVKLPGLINAPLFPKVGAVVAMVNVGGVPVPI